MHFTYCPHCGEKLVEREIGDEGMVPYCEQCSTPLFDMPYACTITIAMNEENEVALIRQGYVSETSYVLVAGYVKCGESAEECAFREVSEELGITPETVTYQGSYYYEKKAMIMLSYLARVRKTEFHISGEVEKAKWFPLSDALGMIREGSIAWKVCKKIYKQFGKTKE